LHVHLDADRCLEVVILRGKTKAVKGIADGLIAAKGEAREARYHNPIASENL
jgi:metal-responsive CopG/Arc/MetJ family transcriptional regulator